MTKCKMVAAHWASFSFETGRFTRDSIIIYNLTKGTCSQLLLEEDLGWYEGVHSWGSADQIRRANGGTSALVFAEWTEYVK